VLNGSGILIERPEDKVFHAPSLHLFHFADSA
jgi:hypothetical protein